MEEVTCDTAADAMGFFPWCSEAAQEAGIFFCEVAGRRLLPGTGWGDGRCGSCGGGLHRREPAVRSVSFADTGLNAFQEIPT